MDHGYINEFDLVDRYLMGRLAGEEITQFEEHFVDCPECIDRLKTTRAFIEGLRIVATDPVPRALTPIPQRSFSSSRHSISRKAFALAAGVLLLVVLSGAVLVVSQVRRFRSEADQARSTSTQWERRYEDERQSSDIAEREHKESERELTGQVTQLQAELENERKRERIGIARQGDGSKQPQINPLIFQLVSARGSGSSASINELAIPRALTSLLISVPLEGESGYKDYRMTIRGDHGKSIWKRRGFKPNQYNSLAAGFNSTFFHDGSYNLTVEGVAGDGSASVIDTYSFRVVKTP